MRPISTAIVVALALVTLPGVGSAAAKEGATAAEPSDPAAEALAALPLRPIGPALMGGRISDIAVEPREPSL